MWSGLLWLRDRMSHTLLFSCRLTVANLQYNCRAMRRIEKAEMKFVTWNLLSLSLKMAKYQSWQNHLYHQIAQVKANSILWRCSMVPMPTLRAVWLQGGKHAKPPCVNTRQLQTRFQWIWFLGCQKQSHEEMLHFYFSNTLRMNGGERKKWCVFFFVCRCRNWSFCCLCERCYSNSRGQRNEKVRGNHSNRKSSKNRHFPAFTVICRWVLSFRNEAHKIETGPFSKSLSS